MHEFEIGHSDAVLKEDDAHMFFILNNSVVNQQNYL